MRLVDDSLRTFCASGSHTRLCLVPHFLDYFMDCSLREVTDVLRMVYMR